MSITLKAVSVKQTAHCRPQTGGKMQTEGKMQTKGKMQTESEMQTEDRRAGVKGRLSSLVEIFENFWFL